MVDTEYLSCIYCHKVYEHDEICIAYLNKDEDVVLTICMRCQDIYVEDEDKKEKEGTGWVVLRREYDMYVAYGPEDVLEELGKRVQEEVDDEEKPGWFF